MIGPKTSLKILMKLVGDELIFFSLLLGQVFWAGGERNSFNSHFVLGIYYFSLFLKKSQSTEENLSNDFFRKNRKEVSVMLG